jgi:hypothetical protein
MPTPHSDSPAALRNAVAQYNYEIEIDNFIYRPERFRRFGVVKALTNNNFVRRPTDVGDVASVALVEVARLSSRP